MRDEKPKDRDFVETVEGLLFCVVGYLHPPDGYTAYLKYIPAPDGRWGRGGARYARVIPYYHVSQVEGTYGLLRERFPQYLLDCPVRNITVSSVPKASVATYYRPRSRLRNIVAEGAQDDLERRLIDLVDLLGRLSGLRLDALGVTGSLLTGSHNPAFSDIDLTVYGLAASRRLKMALRRAEGEGEIQGWSREEREGWSRSRSPRFGLSPEDLMLLSERRWNYGVFRGTYFSVHPVRTDEEITEGYGDLRYRRLGAVTGTAVVTDNAESVYLPALYAVEDARVEGRPLQVEQIASYEGLFCDIFEEGERVEFEGILEEVSGDRTFHRVVVGGAGSGGGYIRLAA